MARSVLTADLKGGRQLEAALHALGKQVATRIGRKAVRDPAKLLQAALVLTAPYLPGARAGRSGTYGHLRDNLEVISVRAKKPGLILYRVSTGGAFWGNFLEQGTVNLKPHPWMRPTVDREQSRLLALQIRILSDGITRVAKRQGVTFDLSDVTSPAPSAPAPPTVAPAPRRPEPANVAAMRAFLRGETDDFRGS